MHRTRPTHLLAALAATAAAALATVVPTAPAAADLPPWWTESSAGLSVSGTYTPIIGNFGGGGAALDDIIWYAPGAGADHLWTSNGNGTFTKALLPTQVGGTYTPVVGNFAGNGLDDILWYAPGATQDHLWTSTGVGFTSQPLTVNGTYQPVVLDDDVSLDDVLWVAPGGGAGSAWAFEGGGAYLSEPFSSPAGARPLTGRFDDGACADVLWYVPGPAADPLWAFDCAGRAGWSYPQTVTGTYEPVVQQLSPGGGSLSDILWFSDAGTSHLWLSDGDGTFTSTPHDLEQAGTPLPVGHNWGLVHVWSTGSDRLFWKVAGAGDDVVRTTGNTELGATYHPLVGRFVGAAPDIFWYAPGAGAERLFHKAP